MATGTVRELKVPLPRRWAFFFVNGGWLPDSRRLLVMSESGLVLVDSETDETTPIQARAGVRNVLTASGRLLMVERLVYDADVWLMEVRR